MVGRIEIAPSVVSRKMYDNGFRAVKGIDLAIRDSTMNLSAIRLRQDHHATHDRRPEEVTAGEIRIGNRNGQ
jgi:hypothetical protein